MENIKQQIKEILYDNMLDVIDTEMSNTIKPKIFNETSITYFLSMNRINVDLFSLSILIRDNFIATSKKI